MAIDKKLIQQVKQAFARVKKAGVTIGVEKLARGRRGYYAPPQQQYYAPPQQQYQAPAPQQVPVGTGLSADDRAALSEQWQAAPQGMQRFHHPTTGEVFYAPDQSSANSYVAGGDKGSLGIQAGMRRDQSVQSLHDAMGQEASSGPGAGVDAPDTPLVGNTRTQYDTFKGYDARTGAHAPTGPSAMDKAIEESRKLRAADPRNQVAAQPAPRADDPRLALNPKMTPLTQGANRPIMGSSGEPLLGNIAKNVGTTGLNTIGNAMKALGTAGPGVGMPGPYNRTTPGTGQHSASPSASIGNALNSAGKALNTVGNSMIPSNAGSLAVPPARTSGGRNY